MYYSEKVNPRPHKHLFKVSQNRKVVFLLGKLICQENVDFARRLTTSGFSVTLYLPIYLLYIKVLDSSALLLCHDYTKEGVFQRTYSSWCCGLVLFFPYTVFRFPSTWDWGTEFNLIHYCSTPDCLTDTSGTNISGLFCMDCGYSTKGYS